VTEWRLGERQRKCRLHKGTTWLAEATDRWRDFQEIHPRQLMIEKLRRRNIRRPMEVPAEVFDSVDVGANRGLGKSAWSGASTQVPCDALHQAEVQPEQRSSAYRGPRSGGVARLIDASDDLGSISFQVMRRSPSRVRARLFVGWPEQMDYHHSCACHYVRG